MPNWCLNTLDIIGPEEDLAAFLEAAKSLPEQDPGDVGALPRESALSFERLLPTPPEAQAKISPARPEGDTRSFEEIARIHLDLMNRPPQNAEEEAYDTWYEWRIRNWGTKWDVEAEVVQRAAGTATLKFDSAWSPPARAIQRASELFPTLAFTLSYDEPGMDYSGSVTFQAGVASNELEGPSVMAALWAEEEEDGD